MWIEFDKQLLNLNTGNKIRISKNTVEFFNVSSPNGIGNEFEKYDTSELAQARYEEIKKMLLGKNRNMLKLQNGSVINLDEIKHLNKESFGKSHTINYSINEYIGYNEVFTTKEERDNRYNQVLKLMGLEV